jgi:hypothetical protein
MSTTYRITYVIGKLDANANPPSVVAVLFPGATVTSCDVTETEYLVTLASPQTPADLGPLVKVEQIQG